MRQAKSYSKALYSIIQFSDQPERMEYINIGVAIFYDDLSKVSYRFAETPREINRVFRISLGKHFDFLVDSVQARLRDEIINFRKEKDLNRFISTRAGKVRYSDLKPISLDGIEGALDYLFENLVKSEPVIKRKRSAKNILSEKLKNKGIDQLLEKPEPFVLNSGPTIKADFGYQNGSYNYIQAVSLLGSVDQAVKNIGGLNLEGKWLYDQTSGLNQRKLNIVADRADQPDNFVRAVKQVFDTSKVKFFLMNEINPLIADIKRSVH